MSEFQFYGFRSIDRNLTKEEQREISKWSSRSEPTATTATFVYNYGDFSQDEEQGLEDYFDVMLYYANFGTKKIMFRLPVEATDYNEMKQYANESSYDFDNNISIYKKGKYVIVKVDCSQDGGYEDYDDPEEYFREMGEWRQMLMNGDYRLLFLGWLHIQSMKEEAYAYPDDEDFKESGYHDEDEPVTVMLPPVPHNIGKLNGALNNFINFYEIESDWLNAAVTLAKQTSASPNAPTFDYTRLIEKLPENQKIDYLQRLLKQELNLHLKLKKDLENASGIKKQASQQSKYTTEDLRNKALKIGEEELQKEKKRKEEAATAKLQKLVTNEEALWKDAIFNIELFNNKGYTEATKTLKSLLKVAQHLNKEEKYQERLTNIRETYSRKRSLIAMLNNIPG